MSSAPGSIVLHRPTPLRPSCESQNRRGCEGWRPLEKLRSAPSPFNAAENCESAGWERLLGSLPLDDETRLREMAEVENELRAPRSSFPSGPFGCHRAIHGNFLLSPTRSASAFADSVYVETTQAPTALRHSYPEITERRVPARPSNSMVHDPLFVEHKDGNDSCETEADLRYL